MDAVQESIGKQSGWSRKLRYARRAMGVGLLLVAAVLLCLWIRSHTTADRLHGRVQGYRDLLIASKQGQVTAFCFKPHGHPNWWRWETRSYPVSDELSFPIWSPSSSTLLQEFRLIGDQPYQVMRSTWEGADGKTVTVFGAAIATLRGSGIVVPYWFLVAVAASLGCLLTRADFLRFGIRSMLILITLTAVMMGLARIIDHSAFGFAPDSSQVPSSWTPPDSPATIVPPPI